MARQVNRLTARAVSTLKEPGRHADGSGLYLIVDGAGKRWSLLFQWRGKRREMGLGPYPAISLADARQRAAEARKLVGEGVDPIEARRASRAPAGRPTLAEAGEALIVSLATGWRNPDTATKWRRNLTVHAAKIAKRPVDEIDTAAVLSVLEPLWKVKPDTAGKLREQLERTLDAAAAQGHRPPDLANPARWRGHLALLLPKRPRLSRGHYAALPYADAPAFMAELRERAGMSFRALEWTVLTAAREGMTLFAVWSEVQGDVWTIPGERMKEPRPFRVPLAPAALDVLKRTGTETGWLFPNPRDVRIPMSDAAMDKALRTLRPGFTVHGFRSTFRDWAGDETGHLREVAEEALAHTVGGATERAYRRADALSKRRRLMEDWATFLTGDQPAPPGRPVE